MRVLKECDYRFVGFHDAGPFDDSEKRIYLRHDIDYSLEWALAFARINAECEVSGTFFFLLRSPIYNLHAYPAMATVKAICALGQRIALHHTIEGGSSTTDEELAARVIADHQAAAAQLPELSPIFSWHNPSLVPGIMQRSLDLMIPGMTNAYSRHFVEGAKYYSDSNLRHTVEALETIIRGSDRALQFLFHPFQWLAQGRDMQEILAKTWVQVIRERETEFLTNHVYRDLFPSGMPDTWLKDLSQSVAGFAMRSLAGESQVKGTFIDVSSFHEGGALFSKPLHLIVKSLDQVERRIRLIAAKQRGRLGRIEHRDVATGLWVRFSLSEGSKVTRESGRVVEYREPRGLADMGDGRFLVSDINRVMLVDSEANILCAFTHPYFAFLHSVSFDRAASRFLVVSSGYDALIEMDLQGNVCWEWFAWEHGFNPTLDGVYLCRRDDLLRQWQAEGKTVVMIDPLKLGALGMMTSQRSNHPNSACYHPADRNRVLVTLGHSGEVIEIDKGSGTWRRVISGLEAMPHAILPYADGWMVTNTLRGEFWLLNRDFEILSKVSVGQLPGKPPEMADHEWLQAVYPVGKDYFVGLDANRGLILIDTVRKQYRIVPVDESWCVHHLVAAQ